MKPKAYSYIRFSTSEQTKGHSFKRQQQLSIEYAEKNNLDLDDTLEMHDLGVSAFKGKNLKEGALGRFVEAIEKDLVKRGSYLLVENLDRLSRDKVQNALRLFLNIIEHDIKIVTLHDQNVYDNNIGINDLLISILGMQRAHEESEVKSIRKKASWVKKFKEADEKIITKWSPPWVYLKDNEFHLIDDRVKLVQNIFEWVLEGKGLSLIINEIEKRNIPPWGVSPSMQEDSKRSLPKRWYPSRVQRILNNRQVLGEFTPNKGKPDQGNVIENYYPKIIEEDVFNRVQVLRKNRNINKDRYAGRKGETYTNLFTGLLKCGYSLQDNILDQTCDGSNSSIRMLNKGSGSLRYLQCSKVCDNPKGSCAPFNKYLEYGFFEMRVLQSIEQTDTKDILSHFSQKKNDFKIMNDELEALVLKRDQEINLQENLLELFKQRDVPNHINEKMSASSVVLEDLNKKIELLSHDIENKTYEVTDSNEAHTLLRDQIIKALDCDQDDDIFRIRSKLADYIKKVVDRIEIYSNPSAEKIYTNSKITPNESIDCESLIQQSEGNLIALVVIVFKSGHINAFSVFKVGRSEPFIVNH